jgi:uncharacterized damage-inducible protein DinB
MSLQKFIHNYASFNSWANSEFADWLQKVDEQLLYQQVPSSFSSIDSTVQHILRVQKFWAAFISLKDVSQFDWSVKEKQALMNVTELKWQSAAMKDEFLNYGENDLTEEITLDMPWAKNRLSRYEYIVHAINHSTFHRGQIITIARGIGLTENLPSTDYNFFNGR